MAKVRTREPVRTQATFGFDLPDDAIPVDHRARLLWRLVDSLDVSGFLRGRRAVEGSRGRDVLSAKMLLTLWLYAVSVNVGSAREIERRTRSDAAFKWIVGDQQVSRTTLAEFRVGHGEALDKVMTDVLAVLLQKGLLSLDLVAQDGTRVRASASAPSFRQWASLEECREHAALHLKAVLAESDGDERARALREQKARDYASRVEAAISELQTLIDDGLGGDIPRASTTDPEARVMKMPDGGFRPAYNMQLATAGDPEGGPRTIVGVRVTNTGSDMGSVAPMLDDIERRTGRSSRRAPRRREPRRRRVDHGRARTRGAPAHLRAEALCRERARCKQERSRRGVARRHEHRRREAVAARASEPLRAAERPRQDALRDGFAARARTWQGDLRRAPFRDLAQPLGARDSSGLSVPFRIARRRGAPSTVLGRGGRAQARSAEHGRGWASPPSTSTIRTLTPLGCSARQSRQAGGQFPVRSSVALRPGNEPREGRRRLALCERRVHLRPRLRALREDVDLRREPGRVIEARRADASVAGAAAALREELGPARRTESASRVDVAAVGDVLEPTQLALNHERVRRDDETGDERRAADVLAVAAMTVDLARAAQPNSDSGPPRSDITLRSSLPCAERVATPACGDKAAAPLQGSAPEPHGISTKKTNTISTNIRRLVMRYVERGDRATLQPSP